MKTALVARAPVFGGKVKSFRAEKAKAVPGVRAVVEVPSGVAVVADHFWAAKLGRDALEIDWDLGAGASLDTAAMRAEYRTLAAKDGLKAAAAGRREPRRSPPRRRRSRPSTTSPSSPTRRWSRSTAPCEIGPDACDVWTGTQFQTGDQGTAAKITGLKPEQVRIHTTFLGGGFGRRANPSSDFVAEAVHVAKAAGVPVKVVWTREDDMRGGYYRPMWAHKLAVGLGEDGMPAAWRQQIVGQSIMEGTPFAMMIKDGVDETSVEGVVDSPYIEATPHHFVGLHSPKSPVPVLWWRSVGHTHTAYVMETMVDELAAAAGQEPRRLPARALREVAAAPRRPGARRWRRPAGPAAAAGQFRGLAVHKSFESYVAQVADVSVDGGRIRVHRVVCAIDCGVCVNPAGVAAQVESAIVYGLSAALYSEVDPEGRPRPAGQLQRLSGAAHERDAEGRGPHRREQREIGRRRRARHAADRARRGQRRLRRDREAAAPASPEARVRRAALALLAVGVRGPRGHGLGAGPGRALGEGGNRRVRDREGGAAAPALPELPHPGRRAAPVRRQPAARAERRARRDGRGVPGLACATCHADSNPPASYGASQPPGAPDWHLPPPERKMVFIDLRRATSAATSRTWTRTAG